MTQHATFAAIRSSIVSDCFFVKPAVADPDADPFRNAGDYADWCMAGSAGEDTLAALRDLGMPDLDGNLYRSVRDAIEVAADAKGLAWINEGLAPREYERPMNGLGGYAD